MKVLEKGILYFQEDIFFSPIRNKIDYAKLLAFSAQLMLVDFDSTGLNPIATLKIISSKMSRIFICKENKLFSVSFPFTISKNSDQLEFRTYSGKIFDNKAISAVISILSNDHFRLNPSPMDFFIEADNFEMLGLSILEEVFQFEPSYIRFDQDKERENGRLHPLYHLDVNYSDYGTYKMGVHDLMTPNLFKDLLDIETDCSFIEAFINNTKKK